MYISSEPEKQYSFSGQTMGTTYRIVYLDEQRRDFKAGVDSVLVAFNQSQSTYIPDSEISRFNRKDTLQFESPFFPEVLESSRVVFEETGGAFDPTIGPLVNVWGFGPEGAQRKDGGSQVPVAEVHRHENDAVPASLGFEKPNPSIDFERSPFVVNSALTPWPQTEGPRRAAWGAGQERSRT
jgi:thiamine biosynthesis lipoprotein ApbE